MRKALVFLFVWLVCANPQSRAAGLAAIRPQLAVVRDNGHSTYYWETIPAGETAQLLTLFCHDCERAMAKGDIPLVSVLKDTLGDNDPANDRLTYVWLLSYSRLGFGQRTLAAVPFFYWRVADGSTGADVRKVHPLMNLTAPERPVMTGLGRDLLQWTALDPAITPIRATSREYWTNTMDQERLHLEEAIGYLREAPLSAAGGGPAAAELDTLTAKLELRKRMLGGLVAERQLTGLGEQAGLDEERIRIRNWELLRQSAEKTGLMFEPLSIAGASSEYGMLWFPLDGASKPSGTSLDALWKLLNIKNPWADNRLKTWTGATFTRAVDENGALLPEQEEGARYIRLIPLSVYSLDYSKLPLLLADFRDKLHVRKHEMTQRAVNEITSGVIGLSHFTNWYYYVGADLYDFVRSRHGSVMDQAARQDCYSRFRVALALDTSLDPTLRKEMRKRVQSLSVNPLETLPEHEIQVAQAHYDTLRTESEDGRLMKLLNQERRSELAAFGQSGRWHVTEAFIHMVTFGLDTPRLKVSSSGLLAALDRERRLRTNLDFLDSMAEAGTEPEVAHETAQISSAVNEVSGLLPQVRSRRVQDEAKNSLSRLKQLTRDTSLQADCSFALDRMNRIHGAGITAKPRDVPAKPHAGVDSAH